MIKKIKKISGLAIVLTVAALLVVSPATANGYREKGKAVWVPSLIFR